MKNKTNIKNMAYMSFKYIKFNCSLYKFLTEINAFPEYKRLFNYFIISFHKNKKIRPLQNPSYVS